MTLLLDLGNTRLKAAWLRDGELRDSARFAMSDERLEQDFIEWLQAPRGVRDSSTTWHRPRPARGEPVVSDATTLHAPHAWLAAVAPDDAIARVTTLLATQGIEARRVTTQSHALGIRIAYPDPARFGVDRFLNLIAAHGRFDGPVLIASLGTALTVDALLADGTHLGGFIAAPPDASRAALVARAPRLDVARGDVAWFATNTEDAVESGTTLAAVALIERALHELERRAGAPATLLLTGGGAPAIGPFLTAHHAVEDLVLHGLAAWALAAGS